MSFTGHAPKDMDDRYNRGDEQDKQGGIEKLEAYRKSVMQDAEKELPAKC